VCGSAPARLTASACCLCLKRLAQRWPAISSTVDLQPPHGLYFSMHNRLTGPGAAPRPLASWYIGRLMQAGFPAQPWRGAHLFRHTIASQMVNAGATFKDVADVLGHQSLSTTSIYAKLDLETLARVALPCQGGVR
jgi:integrase